MSDNNREPSMEEILASIKRVISEEASGKPSTQASEHTPQPVASISSLRASLTGLAADDEDVLDLENPMTLGESLVSDDTFNVSGLKLVEPTEARQPAPSPLAAATPPPVSAAPSPANAAPSPPAAAAPVSRPAPSPAAAPSRAPSASPASPAAPMAGNAALESVVREMLRPVLIQWLDQRLPGIIEEIVKREIARITGKNS